VPGQLVAREISKSYAAVELLDRISLTVAPGDRIGVIGPNGIGKSTLLRVLAGVEPPDDGRVTSTGTRGYLAQEQASSDRSGGQAARSALATIMRADFDFLLLDEPTNNLDFQGLVWLERFLARSPAGVVLVSHDREFLDRTITRVVELEAETRRVREYRGSWSDYEARRAHARAEHEAAYADYAERRDRLAALLSARRTEARGLGTQQTGRRATNALRGKVAQAKRHLERLDVVEKPWSPWELRLTLAPTPAAGSIAELRRAVVARDRFRLGPVDLALAHGDRVAIVGPNGSGKTTLLQALLGHRELAEGTRHVGPATVFGELDQARGLFRGRLLDEFCAVSGLAPPEARTLLAKFALGADDVDRDGASLSPGERTRAALALFAAAGVNCLVLDEPTNHLDLEAIEQLELALGEYDGCLVVVSHDRRFLDRLVLDRTLELRSGVAT
jgi:ATPase subunit of ABC transporter with duplicated ATPase domains